MRLPICLFVPVCVACTSAPPIAAPMLLTGESLAIAGSDGKIHAWGDARRESSLGNLAKFLWLRLEGDEWSARGVGFRCTGPVAGTACILPKGHGRVDLASALEKDCDAAFLKWIVASSAQWKHDYGEGGARIRLQEVFGPFLGGRFSDKDAWPETFGPAWMGNGDLLRASPETFLAWLVAPAQEAMLRQWQNLAMGFFGNLGKDGTWWMNAARATPVEASSTWVVGSNGAYTAILRLPNGKTRKDEIQRFRDLLHITSK